MRKIIAIVWKDIRLRFTSPMEWLFFLILPVVFTVVLAGGTGNRNGRVRLVVVDQAASPLSAELITGLKHSDAVKVDMLTLSQAEKEFDSRRAAAVLIIPAEFDLAHLQTGKMELELRQQPNNLDALVAQRSLLTASSRVSSAVDIAANSTKEAERIQVFSTQSERSSYFDTAMKAAQNGMAAAPDRLKLSEGATEDRIAYDPRANTSAGQLITWAFIPLLGIAGMFAYERQQGTLRRLFTSPTHKAIYLLSTISGQVIIALAQMTLLIGFGILVMGLNWGSAPGALALIMLASCLSAAALGTALGTFVKTESQANGLSIMLGMVMALLGGCWYPIELFPAFVQTAVKILPTRWAMQGMLNIVLRGQDLSGVLTEAGVLLAFSVLFFGIGVWRFRYE